jgi:hypothetical protein
MIFDIILNIIFQIISFWIDLCLPDTGSIYFEYFSGWTTLKAAINKWNLILPVDALFTVIGYAWTIMMITLAFNIFRFLWSAVRGGNIINNHYY